jgi:hypothetical protein
MPGPLRDLLDATGDIADRWAGLSVAARKEVFRLLFARVAVLPANGRRGRDALADRVQVEWRSAKTPK